jgi:outer membrane receptor protein involved in Fe transport
MKLKLSAIVALALTSSVSLGAAEKLTTSTINVYSATPLPSIGLPLNIIPANIQIADPKGVANQTGVSIADYMQNNMQGVTVSEMGGNPWQPEINFRGYSSSPLLGNSQGLSTYIDGVRVNEPFGDVTLWDKIPSFAIGGMQLIPGSNPLYGLNTLGGAIAIQTKSGRNNQGAALEYEAGSWGRQRSLAEFGGVSKDGSVDYIIGYQNTTEDGWRQYSPSHVNQLFSKIGWQNESTKLDLTYIGADNKLIGNGFTPQNLLSGDRDQIHTRPDLTNNYSHFLALNGSHWVNNDVMLSGNVYYRKSNRHTINGDLWELELENDNLDSSIYNPYGFGTGNGLGSAYNCTAVDNDCDELEGIGSAMNRTSTKQDTYGATGQMAFNQDWMGKKNQFIVGAGYDYSRMRFKQFEQINVNEVESDARYPSDHPTEELRGERVYEYEGNATVFDDTRLPIGPYNFARQSTGLSGKQYTVRLFATDTLSLNDKWHLNMGASWNFTRIDNVDVLRGPISPTNPGSLTDRDSYTRLNPTVGLTHTPNDNLTLFASYSESSRAPTSIELGCSNPAMPCLLPSQMADDPPLNQVVAKTYEFGSRGNLTENIRWNAGVYQAMNHDDIQFTAASAVNGAGYYNNIGRTKRQGLDFGLVGNVDKFKWNASYSYVRATYDTDVDFINGSNSEGVSTNDLITAKAGDRIPSIPAHQLKLRGQYSVTPDWNVGANIIGFSDQYVWGNENNAHRANQASCSGSGNPARNCALGSGKLDGYFVVNLDTQYNIGGGWKAFAKATNIFDRDYDISGRLAETLFNSAGAFGNESKQLGLIPGAPRAAWVGFRYEFGGAPEAK